MSNKQYLGYFNKFNPNPSWKEVSDHLLAGKWSLFIQAIRRKVLRLLGLIYPPMRLYSLLFFRAGIKHMTAELDLLLKEASYLNRTAIIPSFILAHPHNLNHRDRYNLVSDYYDLSASFLITPNNEKKPLDYIFAQDLFPLYEHRRIHFFSRDKTILAEETDRFKVIFRTVRGGEETDRGEWALHKLEDKLKLYDFWKNAQLHLELAAPLKSIAKQVTAKLGRYYVLRCRFPDYINRPYKAEWVKKRVPNRSKRHPLIRHFLSGESMCQQLSKRFPSGSNIFIASNLYSPHDKEYFGPLCRLYKTYRYYDFPELTEFVSGKEPNTAQLLLIEQVIEQLSVDRIFIDFLVPYVSLGKKKNRIPPKFFHCNPLLEKTALIKF